MRGSGANGKSIFAEVLLPLMNSFGLATPSTTLMAKQGTGIPSDIARLAGARLVTANETGEGASFNEPLIKDLAGGDFVSARFLRREFLDFTPQFKLWLRGNHKPTIRGTDDGIWRRIHLVPFNVKIPPERQGKHLVSKLRLELPGILAWAVEGALEWQGVGLKPPDKVLAATKEYRSEMDVLGLFLADCCEVGAQLSTTRKLLYTTYQT
jgi:putative DNA primase/helicase